MVYSAYLSNSDFQFLDSLDDVVASLSPGMETFTQPSATASSIVTMDSNHRANEDLALPLPIPRGDTSDEHGVATAPDMTYGFLASHQPGATCFPCAPACCVLGHCACAIFFLQHSQEGNRLSPFSPGKHLHTDHANIGQLPMPMLTDQCATLANEATTTPLPENASSESAARPTLSGSKRGREEKPSFACSVCHKKYSRSQDVRRHARNHDRDGQYYRCDIPDCRSTNRIFRRADCYKRHVRNCH